MTRTFARARKLADRTAEAARVVIVAGCATALIAADQFLPF